MTDSAIHTLRIDPAVGYAMYDADQHYYEAEDALTRHLPPRYRRAVRWVEVDGRRRILLGGQLFSRMPNAAYDPIARPGALSELFRGNNPEGRSAAELLGTEEPIRREYRDRDERLRVQDEHGIEAAMLLPSFGLYLEEHFKRDPATLYAILGAYNDWLAEDWGHAYRDRIFTGPILSLIDPGTAVSHVRTGAERGARFVVLRPGPVTDGLHSWSLGDERHDPVWRAIVDAGMFVVFHAADCGYEADAHRWGEGDPFAGFMSGAFPELLSIHHERPIQESIAALVAHGVFQRHPGLRVATVELGSKWALELFDRARSVFRRQPQLFAEDPCQTMREHVWIAPFYEDGLVELRDAIGVGHVLFGSDWPHPEGLARPSEFLGDLEGFTADEQRLVMADNLRTLIGL